MWQCLDCGEEFEVPGQNSDKELPGVEYDRCPLCGSDDINEL